MKSLHPVSTRPRRKATQPFWAKVRWFIETIRAMFGGPEAIAALCGFARADRDVLHAWLEKAEALVRRILVIEAAYCTIGVLRDYTRELRSAKRIAKNPPRST